MSMESRPRASVVIPTYERRLSVERTLQALSAQTIPADQFEVVVSIDGSMDGTREMIDACRTPYRLVAQWERNRGRAAACNRGLALARGDVIVLLDDDMEPTPGFLAAHLSSHGSGEHRAVIGAAPIVKEGVEPAASAYIRHKFNTHLQQLADPHHVFALRDFYSGNLSIERRVLVESGGFDEQFVIYGNEDIELWWRLRARGVVLTFNKDAVAYQHYTKDFAALARDNIAKGRTAVLLAEKHPATRGQLKLGSFTRAPWLKRVLLHTLLSVTRAWPQTVDAVVAIVPILSRVPAPGRMKLLGLALDFFYFAGVRAAERDVAHPASARVALR
jgi:glycosyltransferase involved in cell wall biosynthesis